MLLISGYPLPVYRGAIAGFIPLVPKPVFCVAICKNPKIGSAKLRDSSVVRATAKNRGSGFSLQGRSTAASVCPSG